MELFHLWLGRQGFVYESLGDRKGYLSGPDGTRFFDEEKIAVEKALRLVYQNRSSSKTGYKVSLELLPRKENGEFQVVGHDLHCLEILPSEAESLIESWVLAEKAKRESQTEKHESTTDTL